MHTNSVAYLKSGTEGREDFHEFQQNLISVFIIHHANLDGPTPHMVCGINIDIQPGQLPDCVLAKNGSNVNEPSQILNCDMLI